MIGRRSSRRSSLAGAVGAAILGFAAMAALQTFSPHLPGNDGYYHLKMALLLPEIGYTQTFPWLRWTVLRDQFVSHHYGFHTLLIPFAYGSQWLTGDAVLGGKVAAAAAMAATFAMFHVLLRRLGLSNTLIWLLLLCAAPWHFWLRMAYVRAPMAALPLLLLAVLWCLRGRTIAVGVAAFLFTQVYGGAVLFPLIPLCFLLGALLAREPLKPAIWQCVAAALGLILGTVLSPYFPANLHFMYTQLFETGLGASEYAGTEWKTFDGWNLLVQSGPLLGVWVWCLAQRLRAAKSADGGELALLLLNVVFLVLTLKARRFVEYWPVFALLHAASLYASSLSARTRPLSGATMSESDSSLAEPVVDAAAAHGSEGSSRPSDQALPALSGAALLRPWHYWALTGLALVVAAMNLAFTRAHLDPGHKVSEIRDAMNYLREQSQPGSLILTDDWDTFPTCFYFNHHNTYAVGLDPEFTRTRYPALWDRYRRITRGEVPATVSVGLLESSPADPLETTCADAKITYDDIAACFGAQYVMVADDHPKLYTALMNRRESFTPIYPAGLSKESPRPPIAIFAVSPRT